jgi:hypothetical protein
MTYDIDLLKKVMDNARNEPSFIPKDKKTFCNFASFRVMQELGQPFFWNEDKNRIMMASEMVTDMDARPELFSKFTSHDIAWKLASKGHLIFAALEGSPHGHIAPIYPTDHMDVSGKWQSKVPLVSNVGIRNAVMGANYAFADPPNYYLVV